MKVLHIARFENNPCSGVSVAVPKHILSQQKQAEVGLVNIENYFVSGILNQFEYNENFSVRSLPRPFSEPDVVIFHEVYYLPFLKIAKELRKLNIPYIVLPHGCLTKNAQHKKFLKKKIANAMFFSKFINNAEAVQYLSENEMSSSGYGKSRFIVPNGIELPTEVKSYNKKDSNKLELLYIGRMDPYHKGLDLLLQAISSLQTTLREKNVVFRLYGPDENSYHSRLEQMVADFHIEDLVVLGDKILGEDKKRALLKADMFIQASRFEGMPMGILEALSYGLPCLLTEGTCIGEAVSKAGAGLVSSTTVEGIADMIRKALGENQNWEVYSKNAISFIKSEYEVNTVASKALSEYSRYSKTEELLNE